MGPVTDWLKDWPAGDSEALNKVIPVIYNELRRLAAIQLGRERRGITLSPTALVHEAFLQLMGTRKIDWDNRSHFFAISARLMRQILIQHARARAAEKRGGGCPQLSLDGLEIRVESAGWVLNLDECLTRLAETDARKAQIVELRYFGGLTAEEVAAVLQISLSTVAREMRMALAWLRRALNGPEYAIAE